jgi:hypothetical protein
LGKLDRDKESRDDVEEMRERERRREKRDARGGDVCG